MNDDIKVIARGSYLDDTDKLFSIEATTVRLSPSILNEWILSSLLNSPECYNTQKEWEQYIATQKQKRAKVEEKILSATGINTQEGSVVITQAISEVFTIVQITKKKEREHYDNQHNGGDSGLSGNQTTQERAL